MAQGGHSPPADTSPEQYVQLVREQLAADGWDLDQTHVSETTYLLGGTTAAADGTRKQGVIVVAAGRGEELARQQLEYARRAGKKYDASVAVVHARSGTPKSLAEVCRQQGVQVIPPSEISPQGANRTAAGGPPGGQPPQNSPPADPARPPDEPTDKSSVLSRRTVVGTTLVGGLGLAGWTLWGGNDGSTDEPATAGDAPATNATDDAGDGTDGPDDANSNDDGDDEEETAGRVDLTVDGSARVAWQYQLDDVGSIPSRPVLVDDTVYAIRADTGDRTEWEDDSAVGVSGSNGMVAIGASDGSVRWSKPWEAAGSQRIGGRDTSIAGATIVRQPPLVLLNRGIELEALSPADGTTAWTTGIATSEYNYNVTNVRDGSQRLVVEGSYSSESDPLQQITYAIRPEDGDISWQSTTEFDSKPQVADGLVYFHTDNHVIGFDQQTGTERFRIAKSDIEVERAVVRDGSLYLLGEVDPDNGVVRAHALSDGSREWRFEMPFSAEQFHQNTDELAVVDGTVYVRPFYWPDENTINGTLYAIDAATGDWRWRLQRDDLTVGPIETTATAVYARVSVRTGRDETREELWALEPTTGRRRWRFDPGAGLDRMAADDGAVYLTTDDAVLYGIDAADGTERWRAEMTGDATFGFHDAPVVAADGAVYVSTFEMGSVFKLVETARS